MGEEEYEDEKEGDCDCEGWDYEPLALWVVVVVGVVVVVVVGVGTVVSFHRATRTIVVVLSVCVEVWVLRFSLVGLVFWFLFIFLLVWECVKKL